MWLEDNAVMGVLGYKDARATAINITLPNGLSVATVCLPMLAILKLLACFSILWAVAPDMSHSRLKHHFTHTCMVSRPDSGHPRRIYHCKSEAVSQAQICRKKLVLIHLLEMLNCGRILAVNGRAEL